MLLCLNEYVPVLRTFGEERMADTKKVLMVGINYSSGVETFEEQLIPALAAQGIQVDRILTWFGDGFDFKPAEGIDVHYDDIGRLVRNHISGRRYDGIHTDTYLLGDGGLDYLLSAIGQAENGECQGIVKPLHSIPENDFQIAYGRDWNREKDRDDIRGHIVDLDKKTMVTADRMVAFSEFFRELAIQFYPHLRPFEGTVDVIPHGVTIPPVDEAQVRKIRGQYAPHGEKLFVSVGRLNEQKDIVGLVRAYQRFRAHHPDTRLIICGDDNNPVYKQKILEALGLEATDKEHIFDKHNEYNGVVFTGKVDFKDIPAYLKAADLAVLNSNYESFGFAAFEPLLVGTPVAVHDIETPSEYIVQGRLTGGKPLGHGFKGWDPASKESALVDMLFYFMHHPEEFKKRAADAQQEVRCIFTWDKAAEKYAETYDHARLTRNTGLYRARIASNPMDTLSRRNLGMALSFLGREHLPEAVMHLERVYQEWGHHQEIGEHLQRCYEQVRRV